jgi:Tol biopolymer transport system component
MATLTALRIGGALLIASLMAAAAALLAGTLAPRGDQIAYLQAGNLYLLDVSHGIVLALTDHGDISAATPPVWSPEGDRIAYVRGQERRMRITVNDLRGDERPTGTPGAILGTIGWSPDGAHIAYAPINGPNRFVYSVDLRSGETTHRGDWIQGESATFSPDGRWLVFKAYSGTGAVAGVRTATDATEMLLSFSPTHPVLQTPSQQPVVWSPAGDRYAAQAVLREGERDAILIVPFAEPEAARVIATDATQPDWSPDGERLAYVQAGEIVIHDLTTDARRTLAPGTSPRWSPDGARLLISDEAGAVRLIDAADGNPHTVIDAGARYPTWRP